MSFFAAFEPGMPGWINTNAPVVQDLSIERTIATSCDISFLEDVLSKKDYAAVIDNSELFWLVFCKAFSKVEGKDSDCFSVSLQGNTLIISGREHIINNIKECVEEIRKFFMRGHKEKKDFIILTIEQATDCFLRAESDIIDLTDWLSDRIKKTDVNWMDAYVKPAMLGLSDSLGAMYSIVDVSQKILSDAVFGIEERNIKAFNITWKTDAHLVYPVSPKEIPKTEGLQKKLYSFYEDQTLCDFTLISEDGEAVKVHSVVLFANGGEVMQKMLTINMTESQKKVATLHGFSLNVIKGFVDFIYLGEEGLDPESVSEKKVDLCGLFRMAHTYSLTPLIDCCTNLLCLFATPSDAEEIKAMSDFYSNDHLKELYAYLSAQNDTNSIKV